MKEINRVYAWVLKFVMPVYAGAAAGLVFGIARDFCIFKFTTSAGDYFKIVYLASAISVFSINAIALSGRKLSVKDLKLLLFINISLLFVSVYVLKSKLPIYDQFYAMLLSVIWIYGAFEANDAFLEGKVILSRTREALGSFLTALLCLFSSPLVIILLLGPFLSVLPFAQRALIRSLGEKRIYSWRKRNLITSAIMTSIAPIAIQYWAYTMTSQPGLVLGIEYPLFIRLATYLFQAIAVGASVLVLVSQETLVQFRKFILTSTAISILLSLYCIFSDAPFSSMSVPLFLGISHVLLILSSLLFNRGPVLV